MLVFLDTEYTDSLNIDLISVGLVSEDGRHEFYGERTDFEKTWCNEFVKAAVFPHLGQLANAQTDRAGLRTRLSAWFAGLQGTVSVACDSYTDWELLLDVLEHEKPAKLIGYFDLRPFGKGKIFNDAVCAYHAVGGHPWHHALHDARALRLGWVAAALNSAD